MKRFFCITLLSCLLVTFILGDGAMGQVRRNYRQPSRPAAGTNDEISDSFEREIRGRLEQGLSRRMTQNEVVFAKDFLRFLVLYVSIARKPTDAEIEETRSVLTRITKYLQQIEEEGSTTDMAATENIFQNLTPGRLGHMFSIANIPVPPEDPRYDNYKIIFELKAQVKKSIVTLQRRLYELLLDEKRQELAKMETDNLPVLQETADVCNKGGIPIIADYYASTEQPNFALMPTEMVATYAALAHIAQGKTKQELQKLLSLEGNKKPDFLLFRNFFIDLAVRYEPAKPYGYTSNGAAVVTTAKKNIYNLLPDAVDVFEKFILSLFINDTAGEDDSRTKKFNSLVSEDFKTRLLRHSFFYFNDINFVDRIFVEGGNGLAPTGEVYDIVKHNNRENMMVVRPVAGVMDSLPDRRAEEGEESIMGESRPFRFDAGSKDIDFFKVEVKEHQTVMVNGQTGYRIPLGVTDMTIVKCIDGAALKQLARRITEQGLQIQESKKISWPVMLYIPQVDFDSELDLKEYAQTKGITTPFTEGEAEFRYGANNPFDGVYIGDAKIPCTFMVDCYGIVAWQQIIPDAVMRAYPMGRDQRLPNNIVIDSPYLLFLTDRKLGAVLGLAFVANPEQSEARKKHDQGTTIMFTL